MLYKQFYSELGKLLYAVADVDGAITAKEKKELIKLVRNELLPLESSRDEFGTDSAYYAEFEFDVMEDTMLEPEAAFDSFISFMDDHKTAIDRRMLIAVSKVAARLADVYRHTNKKEKHLIEALNKKINHLLKEKANA